jgi:hypothetical protein
MGERCPMTVLSGGSASMSAGGYVSWVVGPPVAGVEGGARNLGRVGRPPHEVRIRLIRSRQFRVRMKRVLFMGSQSINEIVISTHYTLDGCLGIKKDTFCPRPF